MSDQTDENCTSTALQYGGIAAGVGLFASSFQNSFDTHSHGAKGVFTRTGGTIGFFGKTSRGIEWWREKGGGFQVCTDWLQVRH